MHARLEPTQDAVTRLREQPVMAVSGIGRPEKFVATLQEAGARIVAERAFGDHQAYTPRDVAVLVDEAMLYDCVVATTEKDMVKLGPLWPDAQRDRLLPVPVTLVFAEAERIETMVSGALASGSAPARAP